MIKAVIFDMDGVLVDSEPFWRQAMVKGFREVGLDFTEEDCKKTTGMRFDLVVSHWFNLKPWPDKTKKELEIGILNDLCELIDKNAQAMPGATDVLSYFKERSYKIGLATSSPHRLIDCIMARLQVRDAFHSIQSAEHLTHGKPHPQVFLNCAAELNIHPEHCLVIEDSLNGVIAAKAAGMKVIAVPEPENRNNIKFSLADLTLNSLKEFNESLLHKSFF